MGLTRALALLVLLVPFAGRSAAAPSLAIVDVDVLPMDAERLLTHRTVLVSGDRITAVGPVAAVYIPDDAVVIRGAGLTLVPGMADMHAHLPALDDATMPIEDYLFLQVARGVTTVRSMRGSAEQLALRARVAGGAPVGPELVLGSVPIVSGSVLTRETARAFAAEAHRQRFDFIKLLAVDSVDEYRALVTAARSENLPVAGHVPTIVGLGLAVASRQRSIEHLDPFFIDDDEEAMKKLATELLAAGVYLCPTLDWYDVQWLRHEPAALARRRGLEYVARSVRDGWAADIEQLRAAAQVHGDRVAKLRRLDSATGVIARLAHFRVPILVGAGEGPSIVPGFGMVNELRALVAAGVTPYVALRGATHDAAAALGNRPFGTIKKGRRADLVLVTGNPLENLDALDRVRGVILRGRWIPPEEIEAGLARIAAEAAKR